VRTGVVRVEVDPFGDFAAYLARIDWLAVLVAGILVAIGLGLIIRLVVPAADRSARRADHVLEAAAGRIHRARHPDVPDTSWLCGACHSWNSPAAVQCYQCRAARARVDAGAPFAGGSGLQRSGRAGRRG
jgi:hypothetical protein